MAIELCEDVDAKLLEVKASGKLTKEDYEDFEPAVNRMIDSVGKIKVLFCMHDFHGWEMGAIWEDTKFAAKHCRDIERLAMVGENAWGKWMATICKPFTCRPSSTSMRAKSRLHATGFPLRTDWDSNQRRF